MVVRNSTPQLGPLPPLEKSLFGAHFGGSAASANHEEGLRDLQQQQKEEEIQAKLTGVEFDSTASRLLKELNNLDSSIRMVISEVEESPDELQLEEKSARVKLLLEDLQVVKKDLKTHAHAQPKREDQDRLLEAIKLYNTDFRKLFTEAKLSWKRKTERECEQALNNMAHSQSAAFQRRKQYMSDAEKVAESNMTLKRATQILSTTLESGNATFTTLRSQSASIQKALEQQRANSALTRKSRSLVSKINRRDITDKILLGFATLVFFLVVLYIVKKRLLYKFNFFE